MSRPTVLAVSGNLDFCKAIARHLGDQCDVYVRWYKQDPRDRGRSCWVNAPWRDGLGTAVEVHELPPHIDLAVVHYSDRAGLPSDYRGRLVVFSFAGLPLMPKGESCPGRPVVPPIRSPSDSIGLAELRRVVQEELASMRDVPSPPSRLPVNRSSSAMESLLRLEQTRLLGQPNQQDRALVSASDDDGALRVRGWHAVKNFLRDAVERNETQFAREAVRLMLEWEDSVGGQHSQRIRNVASQFEKGQLDEAQATADGCYGEFMETCRSGYSVRPHYSTAEAPKGPPPPAIRILIVDDSPEQLRYIAEEIGRLAPGASEYTVQIVRCDPNAPFTTALQRCASNSFHGAIIDWQLGEIVNGSRMSGIDLVSRVKEIFPTICCVIMTGHDVFELMKDEATSGFRPISKSDPSALEIALRVLIQDVRKRAETPFFSALTEYSRRPVSVLHALPISGGRAIRGSPWLAGFGSFYGENVFHAESSSTQAPLDSLLAPRGAILRAEQLAAKVFGAQRVRFVTNGTSTANKIVHQAVLSPGDVVLIDRTCHKSHHYGLVLVGAIPVYLSSPPVQILSNATGEDEFTGFCGPVSAAAVCNALRLHPTAKMLCLSNCTFDGFVHDPQELIDSVFSTLQELSLSTENATKPQDFIFLFDEAWFGFARFSRTMRKYTAMEAAALEFGGIRPRVYATHSTHKTLVAFRQGSMVLISDPKFSAISHQFEESLFTHTTTSPSYQILASLDVGRMWADLGGDAACRELERVAEGVRTAIRSDRRTSRVFQVLEPSDMNLSDDDSPLVLDRSKITLFIKERGITGAMVNAELLKRDIQFNKFTNNTVLLLLTPGVTDSVAAHVISALRELAANLLENGNTAPRNCVESALFTEGVVFHPRTALRDAYFGLCPGAWGAPHALNLDELSAAFSGTAELIGSYVSQRFVIPYPPGFPILVPGQLVTRNHIEYLRSLATKEVHGLTDGKLVVWHALP